MSHALALESRPLALELHALLKDLDPMRLPHWIGRSRMDRSGFEAALRGRVASIAAKLTTLIDRGEHDASDRPERTPLKARLAEIITLLRERVPSANLPSSESREAWSGYRVQLQSAYEALSMNLRTSEVHVPVLRPTNWTRSGVHIAMSVMLVLLVEEALNAQLRWFLPTAFAVFAWSLEAMRHFNETARAFLLWVFKAIAHPHERHRVNSSTWFCTALAILGLAFDPVPIVVALAVLGFADPAAAVMGRRFGRRKLIGNRSLEGSTTFAIVGFGISMLVLGIWHAELALSTRLAVAAAAGVCGALGELLSASKVDDNFSVPMSAAAGASLALALTSFA